MRKMILTVVLLTVTAAVRAADETASSTPAPQSSRSYTVTKGDTLWDLAGKFYQNPYAWPKLWDANKSDVKNPNRIFPSQILAIPDVGEKRPVAAAPSAAAPEESSVSSVPETATAPAPTPEETATRAPQEEAAAPEESAPMEENIVPAVPQETAVAPVPEKKEEQLPEPSAKPVERQGYFSTGAFIAPPGWTTDGAIVGDRDKKMMLSPGDIVYINIGSRRVRPGGQCLVYRKLGKVKDPGTGDLLGYEVQQVGMLEVTDTVGDETATARIINAQDPIEVGDLVNVVEKAE